MLLPTVVLAIALAAPIDVVVMPGFSEGVIPGHVLSRYHVVFDYPKALFTITTNGVLTPGGSAQPMPVSTRQKFPRTEITVAGTTCGMSLGTGASDCNWYRSVLVCLRNT